MYFPNIHTEKIAANRTDIVINDVKNLKDLPINLYELPTRFEYLKKNSNKLNYKDVQFDVPKLWKLETTIILFVIKDIGHDKEGYRKSCEKKCLDTSSFLI